MENLKTRGFKLGDKFKGLDMDHAKLLLGQLALLHGSSYHLIQSYEGGLEKFRQDFDMLFDDGWMTTGSEEMQKQTEQYMARMFGVAAKIVAK